MKLNAAHIWDKMIETQYSFVNETDMEYSRVLYLSMLFLKR